MVLGYKNTSLCTYCNYEESPHHIIFDCPRYNNIHRHNLIDYLNPVSVISVQNNLANLVNDSNNVIYETSFINSLMLIQLPI